MAGLGAEVEEEEVAGSGAEVEEEEGGLACSRDGMLLRSS